MGVVFVLLSGMFMAFPFLTLYLNGPLDVSISTIGLIMGTMTFVGIPFQIGGGALADRVGRRPVLVTAVLGIMTLYLGVAFAPALWVIVLVFGVEAAFGWSMFLTASNAMIADLVPLERRAQAYSLVRTALSAGSATGPLLAAAVLAATASYRLSFVIGSAVCAVVVAIVIAAFGETKPGSTAVEVTGLDEQGRRPVVERQGGGYRRILRDRRFLFLLLAGFATSFSFAQIPTTLPVLLSTIHDIQPQSWAMLLSTHSVALAVLQYPAVRILRGRDTLGLIGVGSLLIGGSLTAIAFAPWGALTVLPILTLAIGVALFMPLVPAVVSHMAPVELRGRYMGLWSFAYIVGFGCGPLLGGRAMDSLGPRGGYLVVGMVGIAGAVLFWSLAITVRRRPAVAASRSTV